MFVLAYVDESGKVVDCSILRGIGQGCDEAALNAVKDTEFTPGMHENKPVKVKVSLTIQFKLQ